MISFEQAQNLKNGDTVFQGKYKCYVVKTKIDKNAQIAVITYTDGSSDNFECRHDSPRLSLTREESPEAVATPPKGEAKPATKTAPAKAPKSQANPMPEDKPENALDRLKEGVNRNSEWRSLDYFEEDRVAIAGAISEKLGIPIHEFENTQETASFHFMTLALAIGKWLHKSGWAEIAMSDERSMNQCEELARSKVMAGILVRLFSHQYVQDLGTMPNFDVMLEAFSQASGVPESMTGYILTAHTYVRQATLIVARHLADGSPNEDGSPVTMGFFDPYNDFLENDHDGFVPPDAVVDAALQLYATLKFLHERASLPASLDGLPEDEPHAHHFLRNYLMFAGMYRKPAVFQLEKLSFKGATFEVAIESLADKKPLVLMDSVFQDGDEKMEIVIPFNPMTRSSDAKSLPGLLAKESQKLPVQPALSVMMFPML